MHVPSGALWGAVDIQKMAARGLVRALKVTMKKHPDSLKLNGTLKERLDEAKREYELGQRSGETILFEGPVRELCPLAPNNVNTMAAAALAARESNIGLDEAVGCLVCDPSLESHNIDVEVTGPTTEGVGAFKVTSNRFNPAAKGAVTGATKCCPACV